MTLSTSRDLVAGSAASLLLLLRQAESRVRGRLQHALDEAGISPEYWRIMAFLLEHPGQRMSAVGEAAVLPSASLTRHVDRLVEHGIVVRRVDPRDRRSAIVALSPHGDELARRLRAEEREVEAELEQILGRDAFQALVDALAAADGLR